MEATERRRNSCGELELSKGDLDLAILGQLASLENNLKVVTSFERACTTFLFVVLEYAELLFYRTT